LLFREPAPPFGEYPPDLRSSFRKGDEKLRYRSSLRCCG